MPGGAGRRAAAAAAALGERREQLLERHVGAPHQAQPAAPPERRAALARVAGLVGVVPIEACTASQSQLTLPSGRFNTRECPTSKGAVRHSPLLSTVVCLECAVTSCETCNSLCTPTTERALPQSPGRSGGGRRGRRGAGRAFAVQVRPQAFRKKALIHLLQAEHIRVVAQQLAHDQRPAVLGRQPPAPRNPPRHGCPPWPSLAGQAPQGCRLTCSAACLLKTGSAGLEETAVGRRCGAHGACCLHAHGAPRRAS